MIMNAAVQERAKHDKAVSIRMPTQTKELIEAAATATNKTFSAFVTESAWTHAIDVLLDQTVFQLDEDQAEAFARVLAEPPRPTQKLRELLSSKAPWEQ
jgi:uncharacterized protein (DUF1778 family)